MAPLGCLPSLPLTVCVCVCAPEQVGTAGPPLWEPLVEGVFTKYTMRGTGYGGRGSATPTTLALRPGQGGHLRTGTQLLPSSQASQEGGQEVLVLSSMGSE